MQSRNQRPTESQRDASEWQPVKPTIASYLACYALYVVVVAGCYANFVVWNSAVQVTAVAIFQTNLSLEAGYAFPMVIILAVLFVVAIWTEHLLRTSVRRGERRRTFTRIAARLIVAALVAIAITTVVDRLILP